MPLQPSSAPRDLRNVSSRQIVLQKSPWRSCKIKIRNYRIGANGFLNQRCALTPDLESILRTRTGKIVLQHNRHECDIARSQMDVRFRGKSCRAADITGTTEFDPLQSLAGSKSCT